jgi:nucleotide-binding universal stress UspA family protein
MDEARIVVGVDGSAAGTAAVRWAATEAWLREVELQVLVAYHWRRPGMRFPSSGQLQRAADQRATAIVDAAVAEARSIATNIPVRGAAVVGYAAPVLLKAAHDADLMVVGSRGRGGFGLLLGSVSSQVATHAPCSVAVVRGRGNTATGTVVVGIDESPSAAAAAGLAFEEAALRRSATLVAVTAYTTPLPPVTVGLTPLPYYAETVEADLRRALTGQLTGWRDKYPNVTSHGEVVNGDAADVLVEKSRQAQLVVVGARSRRGFEGLLLGSVGLHLLHHADCPVLIARSSPIPAAGSQVEPGLVEIRRGGGPRVANPRPT